MTGTIHLEPVLGTLNILSTKIVGKNFEVVMDGKTLLYELQRFLSSGKRGGVETKLFSPANGSGIGIRRDGLAWIFAEQWWESGQLKDEWTLTIPLQSIIDRSTPERYLFMTPLEWRQAHMRAITIAWMAAVERN